MKSILSKFASNPKSLFLMDGIGALISSFMLGVVLVYFQQLIGIPESALEILSIIPFFFALFSFSCYFLVKSKWPFYLEIIAALNSIYCSLTLILIIYFFRELTTLGFLYFSIELIIIIGLIRLEYKTSENKNSN